MSLTATSAVLGRRTCAVLAASSAVLHGFMAMDATGASTMVLIVGMAVACLYCAWELWTQGSLRTWCVVALMNVGMVMAHWSLPGHHHSQSPAEFAAEPPSALMTVATAIAVIEVALAVVVLWYRTRDYASRLALGRSELAHHELCTLRVANCRVPRPLGVLAVHHGGAEAFGGGG